MSAWIVSTRHIDVLVQAATRPDAYGPLRYSYEPHAPEDGTRVSVVCTQTDALGRMLLAENIASVAFRYPDDTFDELPGPTKKTAPAAYRYTDPGTFPIVDELKAIDCYEYQSCEHPQWERSEARAFCQALRHRLVMRLPGYDEAPWGID
jgi:hypothetical protein